MATKLMMTVAIDIRPLFMFKDRGLGAALMTALLGLKINSQQHRYLLLIDEFNYKNNTDSLIRNHFPRFFEILHDDRFHLKVVPGFSHLMGSYDFTFEQLRLWRRFDIPPEAVFLGFSFLSPVLISNPVSLYIPDAFVKVLPKHHDLEDRRIHSWSRVCIHEARQILTCSEHSKADIVHYYHVPPEKIHVIYDNIEDIFVPVPLKTARESLEEIDLPERFILSVGVIEPRKNQVNAVRAFRQYLDETADDIVLVIAGQIGYIHGKIYTEVADEVMRLGLREKVRFLGYVSNEVLVNLYNLSVLLLFPSLYEGFGRPPVEAFCCGTPVIASNRSSLPEITAGAAELVDPEKPTDIAESIGRILNDAGYRQTLIRKGFEVSRRYTLEARSNYLLNALRKVAPSSN